jgi:hypothetical protein
MALDIKAEFKQFVRQRFTAHAGLLGQLIHPDSAHSLLPYCIATVISSIKYQGDRIQPTLDESF